MSLYVYLRNNHPADITDQLRATSEYKYDKIFIEDQDMRIDRDLKRLFELIKEGDTIVIYSLKGFGKLSVQLQELLLYFEEKRIRLVSIDDHIDTQDNRYTLYQLIHILHETNLYCAEFLSTKRIERDGFCVNKAGRPKIPEETASKIIELRNSGQMSYRRIAKECEVSVGTVFKYLNTEVQ